MTDEQKMVYLSLRPPDVNEEDWANYIKRNADLLDRAAKSLGSFVDQKPPV